MGIRWNEEVTKQFGESGKAITNVDDLVIGQTYFSNYNQEEFILLELITDAEHWKRWCKIVEIPNDIERDDTKPAWFVAKKPDGEIVMQSLCDRNIGASYNPWMIFVSKEALEEYNKVQEISFEYTYLDALLDASSDFYDDAEDYDFVENEE